MLDVSSMTSGCKIICRGNIGAEGQGQRLESNSEAKVCFLEVVLTCQYEGEGLCADLTIGEQLACVLPSGCHQVMQ